MHITWELSIGQLMVGLPVLTLAVLMFRIYGMMLTFRIEHEILMRDWAERQTPPQQLHKLPWRQKRWW